MKKLVVLMLALTLITCSFVGTTLARYTSTTTASSQTRVAKWQWAYTINDVALTESSGDTNELNLFADTEIMNLDEDNLVEDSEADTAVKAGLIAPGVGGKFQIVVQNKSEVKATYTITLAEQLSDLDLPIEYNTENVEDGWTGDITTLNAALANKAVDMESAASEPVTIYWRWAYSGVTDGAVDTGFGTDAQEGDITAKITVTIVATQVN